METVHSEQTLYSGRIVTLVLQDVTLQNGQPAKRELIRHVDAVALVALDTAGQVLLVRQYRTGAGQMMLELPAGIIDPGESPETSAVRELQEETGYKPITLVSLGGIHVSPGYVTEYIHLYLAGALVEARLDADVDEFIEVVRVSLDEALGMIERGDITDAKTIVGVLRAARRLGK